MLKFCKNFFFHKSIDNINIYLNKFISHSKTTYFDQYDDVKNTFTFTCV